MLVVAEVTTLDIHCPCGVWLAVITLTGQRQRLRVQPCRRCKSERRPAFPVAFVDSDGRYMVEMFRNPVDVNVLAWPSRGWR